MLGFRFLYTRQLAFDGNFKAVHDRQKRPEDDVFLADGTAFMTERSTYHKHLKVALETKEVSHRSSDLFTKKAMSSHEISPGRGLQ